MNQQLNTITAGELREMIEGLDEDARIAFACNYGDRARTQQVISITGDMEESNLYRSAYSESGWAVCGDSEREHEDTVFIIT